MAHLNVFWALLAREENLEKNLAQKKKLAAVNARINAEKNLEEPNAEEVVVDENTEDEVVCHPYPPIKNILKRKMVDDNIEISL